MIRDEFLADLRCPHDRLPLRRADAALLGKVNEAIRAKRLLSISGRPVEEPLGEALVRQDGKMLYVVRDGIPNLVPDETIPLDFLKS